MKKIVIVLTIFLLFSLISVFQVHLTNAAGSPLQISVAHPGVNCSVGAFYGPNTYSFTYNGGTVTLAGASDETGNIYIDDKLDIEVTHADTTKSTASQDYGTTGTIVTTPPQNVTHLFKSGANTVKITLTNLRTPQCGS